MQSSSGNYSMHHQVPMVYLLLLVYLSAAAYISVEISLGSCWRRDILRSKVKHKSQLLLFVTWLNKYVNIEWLLYDAPTSTHGVFTSFSLSRCCYLHFCRNKFGLMLVQEYF